MKKCILGPEVLPWGSSTTSEATGKDNWKPRPHKLGKKPRQERVQHSAGLTRHGISLMVLPDRRLTPVPLRATLKEWRGFEHSSTNTQIEALKINTKPARYSGFFYSLLLACATPHTLSKMVYVDSNLTMIAPYPLCVEPRPCRP